MNTNRETAQVPGKRSKTFGDHLKAALPWIGGAIAIGSAAVGANSMYNNSKPPKSFGTFDPEDKLFGDHSYTPKHDSYWDD